MIITRFLLNITKVKIKDFIVSHPHFLSFHCPLKFSKSCIRTNGVFSNSFFVERGVRQGDPLSGLLFVLALEPLLCALHNERLNFAPKIGAYSISHSAFADDLTIFCRKASKVKLIYDLLCVFKKASGLKVNNLKTEIHHPTYSHSSICSWPVVRIIKILGILFPTKSRLQINDTIEKLHGQLSFWNTLKLPLFTILTLLNTYTRFQYTLPILEYDARDIKRVNRLVQWAISNDSSAFVATKRYNPLFSASRCLLSNQKFGFSFEVKLFTARLARLARIMCCINSDSKSIPTIYRAQKFVSMMNPTDIVKIKPIPPAIRKHVMLWRRKKIEFNLTAMKPSSSTFHKLLNLDRPKLHRTPDNVPSLQDWPQVHKLHLPPSSKSFLLKTFMNALPTSALTISITCPICSSPLSSHFFQEKACVNINEWTSKRAYPFHFLDSALTIETINIISCSLTPFGNRFALRFTFFLERQKE